MGSRPLFEDFFIGINGKFIRRRFEASWSEKPEFLALVNIEFSSVERLDFFLSNTKKKPKRNIFII